MAHGCQGGTRQPRTIGARRGPRQEENEYPRNYTGDLRVTLAGGEVREFRQPHLRGGVREPLTPDALAAKFHANLAHGGWPRSRADRLERLCGELFDRPRVDLSRI